MFYSENLDKIENITHCFFSRKNGVSGGLYKSLNCGFGSDDFKENIFKNLEFVSQHMNIKKNNLMLMNQTHSNKAIFINEKNQDVNKFNSDALVTNVRGIALGVLTADCVPILIYDTKSKTIGAVHAGWKGALLGIIENTIKTFPKTNGKNNIYSCIGPCIGKVNYEVGEEFFQKFFEESKNNIIFFKKKSKLKFLFNLRAYVHKKLVDSGVNLIDSVNLDTFADKENFFSYRRSKLSGDKDYGRCISTISLKLF